MLIWYPTYNQTGAISDSLLEAHSHSTLVIARMAVGVPTDPKSNHSVDSRRKVRKLLNKYPKQRKIHTQ